MAHADDVLSSPEAGGRVIRGSAWRVGANGAGIVLGLATATLLLRHLGVAESGRYVTVLSLVAIPVYVADIGLNVAGSRELALRDPAERRALIGNILGGAEDVLGGFAHPLIVAGRPARNRIFPLTLNTRPQAARAPAAASGANAGITKR